MSLANWAGLQALTKFGLILLSPPTKVKVKQVSLIKTVKQSRAAYPLTTEQITSITKVPPIGTDDIFILQAKFVNLISSLLLT